MMAKGEPFEFLDGDNLKIDEKFLKNSWCFEFLPNKHRLTLCAKICIF